MPHWNRRSFLAGAASLALLACQQPGVPIMPWNDSLSALEAGTTYLVAAQPDQGFYWPYLLYIPTALAEKPQLLFQIYSNHISDNLDVHLAEARRIVGWSSEGLCEPLGWPLLCPVFLRPWLDGRKDNLCTHCLSRESLEPRGGGLGEIDLQALAMAAHAQAVLANAGIEVPKGLAGFGSSAGGTFINNLAALHPTTFAHVCAGAADMGVLPLAELQGETLLYPLGVADVESFTGKSFDLKSFQTIRFRWFYGEKDRHDPLTGEYTDLIPRELALAARRLVGTSPKERYERTAALYREAGVHDITLKAYPDEGHGLSSAMLADAVAWFQEA